MCNYSIKYLYKNTMKRKLCVILLLGIYFLAMIWYKFQVVTLIQHHCNELNTINQKNVVLERWEGCPKAGDGLNSILVSAYFGGRLGNKIWEYVSAYAIARHYGLWFVVRNESLLELRELFENLSAHCLEELAQRCNFSLKEVKSKSVLINSQQRLLESIENPVADQINLLFLPYHVVLTEEILPWWREMHREMRLTKKLRDYGQNMLSNIEQQAHNSTDTQSTLEYVGVHVRRTDYVYHVVNNYPGAKAADERFFLHAMNWLRTRLNRPLAFVVVSDDLNWCREKLGAPDVFIVGNGNESNPHEDLAILGACNYSIISYGTFGLTGALLANGRFTLLYDTQNQTNTKEMEFAPFIPGWHMLDDDGQERYKPAERIFKFTYVKG